MSPPQITLSQRKMCKGVQTNDTSKNVEQKMLFLISPPQITLLQKHGFNGVKTNGTSHNG